MSKVLYNDITHPHLCANILGIDFIITDGEGKTKLVHSSQS